MVGSQLTGLFVLFALSFRSKLAYPDEDPREELDLYRERRDLLLSSSYLELPAQDATASFERGKCEVRQQEQRESRWAVFS